MISNSDGCLILLSSDWTGILSGTEQAHVSRWGCDWLRCQVKLMLIKNTLAAGKSWRGQVASTLAVDQLASFDTLLPRNAAPTPWICELHNHSAFPSGGWAASASLVISVQAVFPRSPLLFILTCSLLCQSENFTFGSRGCCCCCFSAARSAQLPVQCSVMRKVFYADAMVKRDVSCGILNTPKKAKTRLNAAVIFPLSRLLTFCNRRNDSSWELNRAEKKALINMRQ